jgi:hypothetical protein
MNTPIEVMKAIVDNGGPIDAWTKDSSEKVWLRCIVYGVNILDFDYPFSVHESGYESKAKTIRLTDPNKKICKCVKCKREFEMPLNFSGVILCEACDPHMSRTRPMTPREFARFVGENMGRYLYQQKNWGQDRWESYLLLSNDTDPGCWLYAENVEGELTWRELPEVEDV